MNVKYERLERVANTYYDNISNLAVLCGKDRTFFHSYKNKTGIGEKILNLLQEKCNINPQFIDYGTEPMLLSGNVVKEPEVPYLVNASPLGLIKVVNLPAHANVGSLAGFNDLPVSFHPLLIGNNPENLVGIMVVGDSMKEAGIVDGSIALYDPKSEPYNGTIVVVILNGTILIKRYEKNEEGIIKLHSAHNGVEPIVCNEIDDKLVILGVYKGTFIYP